MKKFLKCSTGLSHGATYCERPTLGKKSNALTTRNSRITAITSGGVEITANEPTLDVAVEAAVPAVGAVDPQRHGDEQSDARSPTGR